VITGCITQPSTPIVHSALLVKNITQRAQSKISEHTVIFKIFILIFHAIHVKNFTQRAQRFLRLTLPFSTGAVQLLFPSFVFPLVANNGKGRIYRYRLGGLQSAPTGIPPSPGICGECASSNGVFCRCSLHTPRVNRTNPAHSFFTLFLSFSACSVYTLCALCNCFLFLYFSVVSLPSRGDCCAIS
jgi:hypothetical protein